MRNAILGYINDSLSEILTSETNVKILEEMQIFTYYKTSGLPKNLVTYRLDGMSPYTRTVKYINSGDSDFHEKTNYQVNSFINVYGTNADNLMRKIFNNINKNDSTFLKHNLGILSYEQIQNLTFIENSKYKERLGLPIVFDYIDDINLNEQGYPITEVDVVVNNAELQI